MENYVTKILIIIVSLAMVIVSIPLFVLPYLNDILPRYTERTILISSSEGTDETGTDETGTDDFEEYEYTVNEDSATLTKYNGTAVNLIVPSALGGYAVTRIGGHAFRGCTNLRSITIPYGVTSIGSYAFYGCGGLGTITILNRGISIDSDAFKGCENITEIYRDYLSPEEDYEGALPP